MATAARKRRSLLDLGIVLIGCTLLWLAAVAVTLLLLGAAFFTGESAAAEVAMSLAIFVAPVGYWLWQRYAAFFDVARGRALRVPDPVVFLRPFAKDDRRIERGFESALWMVALGPLGRIWFGMLLRKTPEEQIERAAMWALGPMVALGSPKDRMPRTGALRVYASDDEWQDLVRLLVGRARAVFMMAGTTSALSWELRHLRASFEPTRMFVFTEPAGAPRDRWTAVRRNFEEAAGLSLPERDVGPGAVIGFDERWQPVVLADGTAVTATLMAAVVSWTQGESRASCPRCAFVLQSEQCNRCAAAETESNAVQATADIADDATGQRGEHQLAGARRSSARFGAWILPLLGRFPFRGLRAAAGLLVAEISFVLTVALQRRAEIAPLALFFLIFAAFAVPLALAVWMLRRAPVRRVVRHAEKRGLRPDVVEHLASIIDTRAAIIGPEEGSHYRSAILLEAPFSSMFPMLQERAIGLRNEAARGAEIERRREVIGGVAYDVVDVLSEDGLRERYHFELADLEFAVASEAQVTGDAAAGPEFLAEVAFPAVPVVLRTNDGPGPVAKSVGAVLTFAIFPGLMAVFMTAVALVASTMTERAGFSSSHLWLFLWGIPPLLMLLHRLLLRKEVVEWRQGWRALIDLQTDVRPSDARIAGGALIAIAAVVAISVLAGAVADANASREAWKRLEDDRTAAAAALGTGDVGAFQTRMTDVVRRLNEAAAEEAIDAEEARQRKVDWERETRVLLARRFDELAATALETHQEAALQSVLQGLRMNDHAARVAAAAEARRQRMAARGVHLNLVAGEGGSKIDPRLLQTLGAPFVTALREKLGEEWDVVTTPRAEGDLYAAAIDVRIDADVYRFYPSWWTGDEAGPRSELEIADSLRQQFVAVPVNVRYTISRVAGESPRAIVHGLELAFGPLPATNPRLDQKQEETTDDSQWTIEDAQAAARRNLDLLQQELARWSGAGRASG